MLGWGCALGGTGIASDGTHVWETCSGGGLGNTVLEFDASTGAFVTEFAGASYGFDVFTPLAGIASDGTHVWVADVDNGPGGSVTELDAATGALVKVLSGPRYGFDFYGVRPVITSDGTHVWVANNFGDLVTELDAATGAPVTVLEGQQYGFDAPDAVASDGTHVWVANGRGNSVTELDAATGALVNVPTGSDYGFNGPSAVALGGGHVWVTNSGAGGNSVTELDAATGADDLITRVQAVRQPGDVVVASIHRRSNWGYGVKEDQVRFAHRLIDGGVDVIHAHSSHHPRPVEVYRGRLVLYGCGDAINDYEGLGGYEQFRGDLRLLYLASVTADTGTLAALHMVPMQARNMRLRHASTADSQWMRATLQRISHDFGSQISHQPDGTLILRP